MAEVLRRVNSSYRCLPGRRRTATKRSNRRINRHLLATFLFVTLSVLTLHAQGDSLHSFEIGPTVLFSYGLQLGTFPIYAGPGDCGTFSNGLLTAPWIGATVQWPRLVNDRLGLTLRIGWSSAAASFAAPPTELQRIVDTTSTNPTVIDIEREFRLDATMRTISLDMLGRLLLLDQWALYLGPSFSYRYGSTIEQTDNVITPGRSFADGERTHVMTEGPTFDVRPIGLGGVIATSASFPVSRRATLVPDLSLRGDILNAVNGVNWRSLTINAGLSLLFDLSAEPDTIPPPPPIDTLIADTIITPPPPPGLAAAIEIHGIDEENRLVSEAVISVREVIFRQNTPLLPAIYFDQGSDSIPERYARLEPRAVSQFSYLSVAEMGALELSHWVLNLVGLRMRENRSVRLTLYGSTSSDEDAALAGKRANSVRNYLNEVWGINRSRIEIRTGAGPIPLSDDATEDGRGENRRVVFASNDPDLLAPIFTERIVRDFNPPLVKLDPFINADAGVMRWSIVLLQMNDTLASFANVDTGGAGRSSVSWRLLDERIDSALGRLTAVLQVEDSTGQIVRARDSIDLRIRRDSQIVVEGQERRGELERLSYALVAFGYRSPIGDKSHESWLREMAESVKPEADVAITGYTDRIGDDRYNLELSQGRADYVGERLRALAAQRGIRDLRIEARGVGVETGRFPNDLPEGRVLSRGVSVLIEQRVDAGDRP